MFKNQLYNTIGKYKVSSFLFYGILGFLSGSIIGVILSLCLKLDSRIVFLMSAIGALTFFSLVIIVKWTTGSVTIVYYHHEISILVLCSIVLYLMDLPVLSYLDIAVLGIGTFLSFGRVGCYSVGCCHGKPYHWGVCYGKEHVEAGFTWYYENVRLFPIQLVESITVILAVLTSIGLLLIGVIPGTILIFYTITYGTLRFFFEFLRGDPERPLFAGLSEAQWTSLGLAVVTYVLSSMGWMPYYSWHMYLLIFMVVFAIATMIYYKSSNMGIIMPAHIKQLMEGISLLKEQNYGGSKTITIYVTDKGLRISCEKHEEQLFHCTISSSKKLSSPSLLKIGGIMNHLINNGGEFKVINKPRNVYHILFLSGNMKPLLINEVA